MLSADERAKYGTTADALDEVREAGIKAISMETVWRGTGRRTGFFVRRGRSGYTAHAIVGLVYGFPYAKSPHCLQWGL